MHYPWIPALAAMTDEGTPASGAAGKRDGPDGLGISKSPDSPDGLLAVQLVSFYMRESPLTS